MTDPFLSRFGTPIVTASLVALVGEQALAHLERPIRHSIPGTLWERVADKEERLSQQVFDLEALA